MFAVLVVHRAVVRRTEIECQTCSAVCAQSVRRSLRVNVSLAATLQRRHAEIKHMFECSGRGARDLLENVHMFDRTHVRSNVRRRAMCEDARKAYPCRYRRRFTTRARARSRGRTRGEAQERPRQCARSQGAREQRGYHVTIAGPSELAQPCARVQVHRVAPIGCCPTGQRAGVVSRWHARPPPFGARLVQCGFGVVS